MGLFDAVRSLFGSEERDSDEESDASTAEHSDSTPDESDSGVSTGEEAQSGADAERDTAGTRADDAGRESDAEASASDDLSEWTFDAKRGREEDGDSSKEGEMPADSDTEPEGGDGDGGDAEPVSWEETGFEQLTTELVDDGAETEEQESDRGDDPAELITEAEPDRGEGASEREGGASETADERASESGGPAVDAGGDERPGGETHLPLDEDPGAVTDDTGGDVDVPEDSPRADFVAEAVDLAEFWGEYDLDFTVASLERVDELIDDQWGPERFEDAEFGGEGYDSEVFTEQVRSIGSYLGEVFVRSHGGEWTRQEEVGWTVDVPAGQDVVAAGATVTVFHIAQSALLGEASVAAKHDGVVDRLGLDGRVGVEDAAATLQRAGGNRAPQGTDEDVGERFRAGAEDLAERWPDYDLDFSTASLSRLEELLDTELDDGRFEGVELGDETDRDSLLLTAHAVGVGGYLAAVLRREHDAEWIIDGRLLVVVETEDERHELDPIEVAVDCIRGERSPVDVLPE